MGRDFALFAPYAQIHAYHAALRDALLGPAAHRSCEALVLPSFEREWSVHLEPASTGAGRDVVCTIMQRPLWGRMEQEAARMNPSTPATNELAALARLPKTTWRFSAPLSATAAIALDKLWEVMLAQTEPAEPVLCLDGTSLFLFQWRPDTGSRVGWGYCPEQGTPVAGLLDLLEHLRSCAGSSGTALMHEDMAIAVKATGLLRHLH